MPKPREVAVFVGSLRTDSINRQLALALAKLAPADRLTFRHIDLRALPHYNQDNDANPPEPVARLKRDVEAADALLFVTPEYNRSIPGVLKNAIDTASRPYGKSSFGRKPAGVIGASVGAIGTAPAQQHLRNVLAYLDVPTMGQPEAYIHYTDGLVDADSNVTDARVRGFLQTWIERYAQWVETAGR